MPDKPVLLHDNRLLDGTPAATDTDSGSEYDVLNIRDLRPYTWWKAASFGTKYITIDCGSAKGVDALGITGHNLGTAAASVSVESSGTGAWAGEEVQRLAPFNPSDDKASLKLFASASAQHWRVKIVTASVVPQLAVLLLGERFTFERFIRSGFDPQLEEIVGESTTSKTGHMLGAVIRHIRHPIAASWTKLTPTWVSDTFRPAWDDHLSQLKPFFFAWEPTDHSDEVLFLRVQDGYQLDMPYDPVRRSLDLQMVGVKE